MAFSVGGTAALVAPPLAIPEAIELITTGKCHRLPRILEDEFRTIEFGSEEERRLWISRLDNVLKKSLLHLDLSPSIHILAVAEGAVTVAFFGTVQVQLTLVPQFETQGYAWHILSASVPWITEKRLSDVFLHQLQHKYNRRPVSAGSDLATQLCTVIDLFRHLYVLSHIRMQFEELKVHVLPVLEVTPVSHTSFSVSLWSKDKIVLLYSLETASSPAQSGEALKLVRTFESASEPISLSGGVPDKFASEQISAILTRVSDAKIQSLAGKLRKVAADSWCMYDDGQISPAGCISLLHETPLQISVASATGQFACADKRLARLLNDGKLEGFVRAVGQLRLKSLERQLSETRSTLYTLIDSSVVSLPQLGPNHVVLVLGQFYGKLLAVDFGSASSPRIYVGSEGRVSGRVDVEEIVLNPVSDLANLPMDLERVASQIYPRIIQHDLDALGIRHVPIGANAYRLVNIAALPHVRTVELHHFRVLVTLETGRVFELDGGARLDLLALLQRLRGLLALLCISKQLEIHGYQHEMDSGQLAFSHPRVGVIRLAYDPAASETEVPLLIEFADGSDISPDHLRLIRLQVRRSTNILTVVDYLNRMAQQ